MKVAINFSNIVIKVEYYDTFAIVCNENKQQKELVFGGYITKKKIYFTHCLQTIESYSFPLGVQLRTRRGSDFYEQSKKNFIEFIQSTDMKDIKHLMKFKN